MAHYCPIFLSSGLQVGLPGIKQPAKALYCLSHKILTCLTLKVIYDLVPFYISTSASQDPLTCALQWRPVGHGVIFSRLPGSLPMLFMEVGWQVHLGRLLHSAYAHLTDMSKTYPVPQNLATFTELPWVLQPTWSTLSKILIFYTATEQSIIYWQHLYCVYVCERDSYSPVLFSNSVRIGAPQSLLYTGFSN